MADLVSSETKNKSYVDMKCLQPWLLKQLKLLKIEKPTPIQYHCIPQAIEGKDIIGAAKTGSGKTLAFVLPILHHFSIEPYGIYALVLTPTRELAFQIADQFKGIGAPALLKLSVVVGGMDKVEQGAQLSRSPHVVIATPGRLADIMETSPELNFKKIKFLVVDEADRLMDGRFDQQLKVIWDFLPSKRQTLLFSATVTDRIQRMKDFAKSDVFVWQSSGTQATVQQLDEKYALVNRTIKDAAMVATVLKFKEEHPKGSVIIFTDTCKSTQILYMMMNSLGMESVCLHSMMKQIDRNAALTRFKSSQIRFMIATDLASRGLDIPMVQLVINHCIPNLPKTYIHRVGRTARAGRPGSAVTFITPYEIKLLLAIEGETNRKMTEKKVNDSQIQKILREVNITKREQQVKLERTDFDERRIINKRKRFILEGKDPDEEEREKLKRTKEKRKFAKKNKETNSDFQYPDDENNTFGMKKILPQENKIENRNLEDKNENRKKNRQLKNKIKINSIVNNEDLGDIFKEKKIDLKDTFKRKKIDLKDTFKRKKIDLKDKFKGKKEDLTNSFKEKKKKLKSKKSGIKFNKKK